MVPVMYHFKNIGKVLLCKICIWLLSDPDPAIDSDPKGFGSTSLRQMTKETERYPNWETGTGFTWRRYGIDPKHSLVPSTRVITTMIWKATNFDWQTWTMSFILLSNALTKTWRDECKGQSHLTDTGCFRCSSFPIRKGRHASLNNE